MWICLNQAVADCDQLATSLRTSSCSSSVCIKSKQTGWFHPTDCKLFMTGLLLPVFNKTAASCVHQLAADPRPSSCDRQVSSGLSRLDELAWLMQSVDSLRQLGKTNSLQQVCDISGRVAFSRSFACAFYNFLLIGRYFSGDAKRKQKFSNVIG